MAEKSRNRDDPWNLNEILDVLRDRINCTCEIDAGDLDTLMEEISSFVSTYHFHLHSVQEASSRKLTPTKITRLEKMVKEFEVLGAVKANTIRAWIELAKFGTFHRRDALGQGVSILVKYLKSAHVSKPYYWSVLLLAHARTPLALLGVDQAEVAKIPSKFPVRFIRAPKLPVLADKVNARIEARVGRWRKSESGKSVLAVFGEPSPAKLLRSK